MPEFARPVTSADDAAEHLRALAHATQRFGDPGDTYWVTGSVLAITRRLQAVLVNVASAHTAHRDHARTDDGNQLEGRKHAADAALTLRRASLLLEQAEGLIDKAQSHSGRIAWHRTAPPVQDAVQAEPHRPGGRVIGLGPQRSHQPKPGRTL
ncbi:MULTISPECIES: hypothetical protein [unclassified Isoptericola]|uniref:hypothetical protein n=1 Tax=unclassified Isoptericola TaxID=2623355 RepID=UPI00365244B4